MVLVSCGSFNPPTFMHLRMLELAQQAMAQVRLQSSGVTRGVDASPKGACQGLCCDRGTLHVRHGLAGAA